MLHKQFNTTMVARKEKGRRHKSHEKMEASVFFFLSYATHHNIEEIKEKCYHIYKFKNNSVSMNM